MSRIGRYLLLSAIAVWMLCMHTAVAYASYASVTAEILVQLNLVGEADDPEETYSVVLASNSSSDPMPSGSMDGVFVMEMRGAGEASFSITYERPGIYHYQITQRSGTDKNCQYGDDVYYVTVYVTNGLMDASMLDVSVKAERLGGADGKSVIEFTNTYTEPETSDPSTGTDMPGASAESEAAAPEASVESEAKEEIFGSKDTPKTGDDTDLVFYQAMLYGSLVMIITVLVSRKKKEI